MCNDKKEGGRVFSDDHHRNDLDKTDTKNSTDKPPSWLHFCQNKFRISGCWLVCKNTCTKFLLNVYKKAMALTSFHPYPWNHRIAKTGKDPVQTPDPATHQVLPPGKGGWQQLLPRAGTYSHCPKEGNCCQEFKVASHSLLTVNILQPVITACFNPPLWKKLTISKAGVVQLWLLLPTPPDSFQSSSGVLQPPRDHGQQSDCPWGRWLWLWTAQATSCPNKRIPTSSLLGKS